MAETRRRDFLKTAGAAAAGAAASARGSGANGSINIGCLGTGGRCQTLMKTLAMVPGVRLAAVCDVFAPNLAKGQELADPKAFATKEYREVLDRKDIDAVVIAAPDHWHVPMTIDACQAGKDVYVEKPLTHKISEGEAVIRAVRDNKRVVQVGTQQRSMPQFVAGYDLVKSGKLGKVHKVHLTWNRNAIGWKGPKQPKVASSNLDWEKFVVPARKQPFDEYRYRNWTFFWDFGGGILTDLMVHFIDVANWYLGLNHPETAASIGDNFFDKRWETPDTIQTLLRYPLQEVQVYFEGTFVNSRNRAMLESSHPRRTPGQALARRHLRRVRPQPERRRQQTARGAWRLGGKPTLYRDAAEAGVPVHRAGGGQPESRGDASYPNPNRREKL